MSDQRIGTCTVCLTAVTLPYPASGRHVTRVTAPYRGPVAGTWDDGAPGALTLPSGRRVRGRAWRELPAGSLPDLGIYLLGREPEAVPWESRGIRWRDFSLPAEPDRLRAALTEAWERAPDQRVEIACPGETGRTGTGLACLAVLDGVPPERAIEFVRAGYRARAVETRAQAAFVTRFAGW
jgi:hypothetical protein